MTDFESMTMADLAAAILAKGDILFDRYREEFTRRVRPDLNRPAADPVQDILARIREHEPAGDTARLLAVADLAAGEHAPYVWQGRGPGAAECATCMDWSAEPDHAQWPCDPYIRLLLALGGAQQPVPAEVVRSELRPRAGRASLPGPRVTPGGLRPGGRSPRH